MSARAKQKMPEADLARYRTLVATAMGVELKGASMPYTSVDGNMFSFLDKAGSCAIRLGPEDLAAFKASFKVDNYLHESGMVMKDYVALPPKVFADATAAKPWFKRSVAYAKTLKSKATTRKKSV